MPSTRTHSCAVLESAHNAGHMNKTVYNRAMYRNKNENNRNKQERNNMTTSKKKLINRKRADLVSEIHRLHRRASRREARLATLEVWIDDALRAGKK